METLEGERSPNEAPRESAQARPAGTHRAEAVISAAMAAVVVVSILVLQRKWQPASLRDVASSAEEFILQTAGVRGQIPDIPGYETLKVFRLGRHGAALYRATPAPLAFAAGRLVIYNRASQPVFQLETIEGSEEPWTELYDFSGHRGTAVRGSHSRSAYTRSLTGNGELDIVVGQYSGGDQCCTTATVVELGNDAVKVLIRIVGLAGMPFEGLEVTKPDRDHPAVIIAHQPGPTLCGSEKEGADIVSIYGYADGQYSDQTPRSASYLEGILRQNLTKWSLGRAHTFQMMQTLTAQYAALGKRGEANRFFGANFKEFVPELQKQGVDTNACLSGVNDFLDAVSGGRR